MKCDICIIGAGPAGYSGALRAARQGMRVVLVEKDRPGGTCLNRGCIPTKALRRCADALTEASRAREFGVVAPEPGFDYKGAASHRDRVTEALVSGVESLIKARKIEVIKGQGKLLSPGRVEVDSDKGAISIECGHAVIAAGSAPCDLPGIRIDNERVVSSEGALKWNALPSSLVVVGAGVIGCEFADIMAVFGSRVTVVETMDRILLTEDKITARTVKKALEARGVEFRLSATIDSVEPDGDGVKCRLSTGGEISAERVIVSVGRRPALDGIGPEGPALESGAVRVDRGGRTSQERVWAAGDVIGPPMLAHAAVHEMEVVIDNIMGADKSFDRDSIPSAVFVRPEVASVGLLEDAAREKGMDFEVGRFAYAASGKALCMGEPEGMAKVVVDRGDGRILGGTIIGAHASDLIAELALARKMGITVAEFIEVVHVHPTLSEVVLEAVADSKGLALHKAGRAGKGGKRG